MSYQHLTQAQRYQIDRLHKEGFSSRQVASPIECHHSTVARERKRNLGEHGYRAAHAHGQAVIRRRIASRRPRIDAATWGQVEERLRDDWSPEQIASKGKIAISPERIYQHIQTDRKAGGDLWTHRRRRRRRQSRIGTARERQRFHGRRIQERAATIEKRQRVGHWEADSVVGKGAARLITLVERKSRYVKVIRVKGGTARSASEAIIAALYPLRRCVQTITYDNGSEFAEHALIDTALGTQGFFADPHSPWQRGTNENMAIPFLGPTA